MTDREAMQQALEALEEINKLSIGENAICLPAEIDEAMDALRERLAQPEPPVLTGIDCSCGKKWRILNNTLTASEPETVMAEYKHQTYAAYKTDGEMKIGVVPEQEQAMLDAITGGTGVMLGGKRIDPSTIYKEPEQEPVAEVKLMMTGGNAGIATRIVEIDDPLRERLHPGQLLYTAPQPRQWQGLAHLEFQKAVEGLEDLEDCWIAIESALREKNT